VPDYYPLNAAGFRVDENGVKYIRVKGVRWFTNLDHGRRHEELRLMTLAENLEYSRHEEIRGKAAYDKYDNYDLLEAPFIDAIPSDYPGVIDVPVSFLDKYCPDQFEILSTSDNGLIDDTYKTIQGFTRKFVGDYYRAGGKGAYQQCNPTGGLYVNGIATMIYKRIFIRHRKEK